MYLDIIFNNPYFLAENTTEYECDVTTLYVFLLISLFVENLYDSCLGGLRQVTFLSQYLYGNRAI